MEWSKLIEELEKEGITAFEANRMIRAYQIIESVIDNVKELGPTEK